MCAIVGAVILLGAAIPAAPSAAVAPPEPTAVPPEGWLTRAAIVRGLASPLPSSAPGDVALASPAPSASPLPTPSPTPAPPSDTLRLRLVENITGGLTPKSVVASQTGVFFAQNVGYLHTMSIFNRRFRRVKTLSDTVVLGKFIKGAPMVKVRGAPVEAAASVDGRFMYVSQYSMEGPGFRNPGFDTCTPADQVDDSYVYKVDTEKLRVVDLIRVGRVPKYLATSPDGRWLLVANWCSWDVTVVDLRRWKVVASIPVGADPRGIAFSPDSRRAWVGVVASDKLALIDLKRLEVIREYPTLDAPRHLVMGKNGRYLYVVIEGAESEKKVDGYVLKLDTRTGEVVDRVGGMVEPRTMVAAPDGRSLYVADFYDNAVIKLAADDLRVIQKVPGLLHAIGITYDAKSRQVWVAGYLGNVWVLEDLRPGEKTSKEIARQKARRKAREEAGAGTGTHGNMRDGKGGRQGGGRRGRGG